MKIVLGKKYKDVISDFKGIAVGHCEYLSGCHQTLLVPKGKTKEGKQKESEWFDDQRLVLCGAASIIKLDNSTTPGADKAGPKNNGVF
jgi:hypothetical protein